MNILKNYFPNNSYRNEIDGLRAFAVIAVIVNHFNKDLLPSGFLGVDIFFVISGYVITSSLSRRRDGNFLDFISNFYSRRIIRIIPALLIVILFSTLLTCLIHPQARSSLNTGFASLFGLSNIYLVRIATDYFAQSTEINPFTHTWSLGVEEQFYFLFPILVWFSGFSKQEKKSYKNLFFIMLTLAIPSLIGFIYFYSINPSATYFLMPFRFWEIGLGSFTFILINKNLRIRKQFEKIPSIIIFLILLILMFLPLKLSVLSTILITFLTSILIICINKNSILFRLLTNGKICYLGLMSYSLYLWHWPILSFSRLTIGVNWWSIPFQIIIIFGLSYLSYNYIETPFRKKFIPRNNILVILKGILVIFISSIFLFSSRIFSDTIFLGNKNRERSLIYSESIKWNGILCRYTNVPSNKKYSEKFNHCWINQNNIYKIKGSKSNKKIFTFGDSYNEQIVPAYLEISKLNNYHINAIYTSKCDFYEVFLDKKSLSRICNIHLERYVEWLMKYAKKGDIFILANSLSDFFSFSKINYNKTPDELLEEYLKILKYLSQKLDSIGVELVVISGIPLLNHNPDICSQWFTSLNNKCDIDSLFNNKKNKEVKRINNYIKDNANGYFKFINIFNLINNELYNNPSPWDYYYNENHLSKKGAKLINDEINYELHN